MGTTTQVFAGNSAVAYAAFNLRDPYYPEMARFVIDAAKARLGGKLGMVVDLGAGIGMSTMEILKEPDAERVIAVEPEEGMRYFCELNTMGDPRVFVREGRGEALKSAFWQDDVVGGGYYEWDRFDAVLCCQAFHLFNPPVKESLIPRVLREVAAVLRPGGVFAFDLGPSNFVFAAPLSDHRSGEVKYGAIITELSHPLYQRAHAIAYEIVKREFPGFDRENLWPPATARMDLQFLRAEREKAGFRDFEMREDFSPVSGKRVINFIRNGWSVWFRWPPLSDLPAGRKLEIIGEVLRELFRQSDFATMQTVMSYHPTAVFTAVKA